MGQKSQDRSNATRKKTAPPEHKTPDSMKGIRQPKKRTDGTVAWTVVKTPDSTISSLMCDEDEDCLLLRSNGVDESFDFGAEFDEEYVTMLIEKEDDVVGFKGFEDQFESDPSSDSKSSNWPAVARLDAVSWILNVRALFGFQFNTVYLATAYFDRFFSCKSIDDGKYLAVRLASIACLSVAAKIEELNVPVLSEYLLDEYIFEKRAIQRMELLVLSTLEWKMSCITPFAYFGYLADKFCLDCISKPKCQLFVEATEHVMEMLPRINLVSCKPSSIAAAAVLAATDFHLTEKALIDKLGMIKLSRPLRSEEVLCIYRFVQETKKRKCKTPELDILPIRSLTQEKYVSTTSNSGTKRQLSYDDNDEDHERSSRKKSQ